MVFHRPFIDCRRAGQTRIGATAEREGIMSTTATWIVILTCAYMEYSTWRGRYIYRRTVGYEKVVWC
ncbi:hypothetical protein B5G54_09445 [Ralstonia solanacearum]|nr:hypothetical protein AR465_11650 [Ralstonia solanacearum]OPK48574.1 hypothetical protein B5G54_09445 [Ralstonia solanacearum]OPK56033.1 hypothetical protein B5J95_11615 [Ralstonia solanacearum]PNQ38358.1 hypothetical protein CVT21_18840 [Ralstonia solanacearum]